jgi:integrase
MGARSSGARKERRRGRLVWIIDFTYRDKAGRTQRYRHDAAVQTATAARAEAARLMFLAATTGSVVDETPPCITFDAFVAEDGLWRKLYLPKLRPATRGRYLDLLGQGILEHFGQLRLDQVDAMTVRSYAAKLASRKPKAIQARPHLSLVSAILKAAHECGELRELPELPPLPRGSQKLPDCPDDTEIEAILAVASGWLRIAIALSCYAGLRSGEVRALEVRDVDLRRGRLLIRRSISATEVVLPKNGKERSVPIAPPLRPILEAAIKGKLPLARVIVNQAGTTPKRQDLWNDLDALLERNKLRHRSFHSIRHYWCSALLDRGVSLMAVKEGAGHSDLKTTQRYLHNLKTLDKVW